MLSTAEGGVWVHGILNRYSNDDFETGSVALFVFISGHWSSHFPANQVKLMLVASLFSMGAMEASMAFITFDEVFILSV